MRNLRITFFIVVIFGLSACFSKKEDPLEKERAEFNKELEDNSALTIYRGLKVSIRSLPLDSFPENADKAQLSDAKNIQLYTFQFIQKLLGNVDTTKTFTLADGIELYRIFSNLKDELKDADEDNYPTVLEVMLNFNQINENETVDFIKTVGWNNTMEHLTLGLLLTAAKQLPESLSLYEISKLKIDELGKTEIKPLAAIIKGFTFMQNKWFYLSEEALTQGINSLDNDKIVFQYPNTPALFDGTKVDNYEGQIAQLHAISCLLRGYARTKMDDEDKNDLALADFELFMKDAETLGMNNELTWFTGAYINIKKEDSEKAVPYLDSLQKSEYLTDNERDAISEVKNYLSDRKPDKAINTIYDKFFIGKLVSKYIYNYYVKYDWYKKIKESETGSKFLEFPEAIESEYQKMDIKIGTDELEKKGKELLKDIF